MPRLLTGIRDLAGKVDAAIVATPTTTHEAIGRACSKPASTSWSKSPSPLDLPAGERLIELAERRGRILQVGHLERFNPAVVELERRATLPLFFEVHRLNLFSPRSLDVDVVLDLMIHDVDIVLALAAPNPQEIRAAGISVLSDKVDIANVRLQFPNGCIANLTASRVSTESVRKLRLFQPNQYLSLDYARQDATSISVTGSPAALPEIGFSALPIEKAEPLELELGSFVQAVRSRMPPVVDGRQATAALRLAEAILVKIKEHSNLVAETLRPSRRAPSS